MFKDTDTLILTNLAHARRLAERYYYERTMFGIGLDDFESAAVLGLCQAATRFDPNKGLNFQTYSFRRIIGAMQDLMRKMGPVAFCHIREQRREEQRNELPAEQAPSDDGGDDVDASCSSFKFMPLSVSLSESLDEAAEDRSKSSSSHLPVAAASRSSLSAAARLEDPSPDPEQEAISRQQLALLGVAIKRLNPRQQKFIEKRYFEEKPLHQIVIGKKRYSKSGSCRINRDTLKDLRQKMARLTRGGMRNAA